MNLSGCDAPCPSYNDHLNQVYGMQTDQYHAQYDVPSPTYDHQLNQIYGVQATQYHDPIPQLHPAVKQGEEPGSGTLLSPDLAQPASGLPVLDQRNLPTPEQQ